MNAQNLLQSKGFNFVIFGAIVTNGLLIGWQTYDSCPFYVKYIQLFLLLIFLIEIALRWLGRTSSKDYFADGWNYFDVFVLFAGVLPEVISILSPDALDSEQSSVIATLRLLRVVQLSRSIRAFEDLRLLVAVFMRSLRSLFYTLVLLLLVMYTYAVIGVTLFKNRDYKNSEHLQMTQNHPDPWGGVGEGCFTLFSVMTGADWPELRYNALNNEFTQKDDGKTSRPKSANITITLFYVSWILIAGYLLLNLFVSVIIANIKMALEARSN